MMSILEQPFEADNQVLRLCFFLLSPLKQNPKPPHFTLIHASELVLKYAMIISLPCLTIAQVFVYNTVRDGSET